jgi:PAS domain S-box-containing protein
MVFLNDAGKKMLGISEEDIAQINIMQVIPEHLQDKVQQEVLPSIDEYGFWEGDLQYLNLKTGGLTDVHAITYKITDPDTGVMQFLANISLDITERKQAEEQSKTIETQLAHAQKMESIGTLAGGIAHDFNNILSAIIGYSELAMEDVSDPQKAKREIKEVLKAADRAKELAKHILTFSRKADVEYSPIALRTVVKDSIKMLRAIIPTTIDIQQDLTDSGLIMSNPTQINQILMNLCTNSSHAMDKTGGVLKISLKRMNINKDTEARELNLRFGPYLMLSVSDTGHGIPSEILDRIFEPYFTTKEMDRGTGLGLSVVHGIVISHGGNIICKSAPGKGTSFDIFLPEIESMKEVVTHTEEEPLPTGKEHILFVDDESVLVNLAQKMLSKLGYTIETSINGDEALKLFQDSPDKYDLIITDMTMPGMTGDRLAQKFMEIRQDIPIILCSGYSEHISKEKAKKIGIREFVMKPLEMKALAKTIRKVLAEKN